MRHEGDQALRLGWVRREQLAKDHVGEAEAEAKKCSNITEYIYTDGQGDTQKSISDLNGLAAQGVDAMVVFPDGQ